MATIVAQRNVIQALRSLGGVAPPAPVEPPAPVAFGLRWPPTTFINWPGVNRINWPGL